MCIKQFKIHIRNCIKANNVETLNINCKNDLRFKREKAALVHEILPLQEDQKYCLNSISREAVSMTTTHDHQISRQREKYKGGDEKSSKLRK